MPNVQVDHSLLVPSILPTDIPDLSDDECLALLARGRLAVAIE